MKKIISLLVLSALLISSLLTVIPVAAAEEAAPAKTNVLANPRDDQMAGIGSAFYYDFHLYDYDIGKYPITDIVRPDGEVGYQGQRPYMLRSKNAAGGSAFPIDGSLDTWESTYNTFNPSDELSVITDCEGTVYDFDAWVGFSIRDTAMVDSFAFYTLNDSTKGGKLLIEGLTLFGAVVDPTLHTYAPNSWFRMTDTITDVQATSTEDGRFAVVIGDLNNTYEVDYLFLAFNIEGDGAGDYACVEIELYEDESDYLDMEDLDTDAFTEALGFAEAALANEAGYTVDSYAVLKAAYDAVKRIAERETASQAMIDKATTKLYTALGELDAIADTSGLVSELAKYENVVETDYTTSSWATFKAARDAATALLDSGNNSEEAINEHIAALSAAGEGLARKASAEEIAAVEAKVAEAGEIDEEEYTAKSIGDLRVIMRDTNIVIKADANDISAAACEAAIKTLDDAIAALEPRADFAALQAVLDSALSIESTGYTAGSYAAYSAAIAELQAFITAQSNNASVADGEALTDAVVAAKLALVKLADFAAIDAKIEELASLLDTDYTAESWKALQDAIAAAKALKGTDADQAAADSALAAITAAADALVKPAATDPAADPGEEGGCGGVVSVTAVVLVAALGFGITALKRR